MELKHSERRQLKTAGSVVAEKVVKLTQNAIFGHCCMNPDKFRNTNAYVGPAKFERAVGKSSVTNFELQINDSEGFVETLKTDRSKACMSVPAAALQAHDGEGLLPPHEEALPEDEAALHGHRLRDGADLRAAGPAPRHGRGEPERRRPLRRGRQVQGPREGPERALCSGARQGHRGDGPAGQARRRDLPRQDPGVRGPALQDVQHPHVQPDGARKEKRKIKGVPKKAVTNVRHLEYREVLEEGSERRAAFAQLRSRAHEIAVETVEKKSLSPFNDKVYGLDAHNSRPLGHWRNLEQLRMLGAYAPPGSAPFDLVMEFLVGPPPRAPWLACDLCR